MYIITETSYLNGKGYLPQTHIYNTYEKALTKALDIASHFYDENFQVTASHYRTDKGPQTKPLFHITKKENETLQVTKYTKTQKHIETKYTQQTINSETGIINYSKNENGETLQEFLQTEPTIYKR